MKKNLPFLATISAIACSFVLASCTTSQENQTPTLKKVEETAIYGEGFTNGNSTLKLDLGQKLTFSEDSYASFVIEGEDVDTTMIDISKAKVSLLEGESYSLENLELETTDLEKIEDGSIIYRLSEDSLKWNNGAYPVNNGGLEWSALGGDGNGHYKINLSLSGVLYDKTELPKQDFYAEIYIYGREFSGGKNGAAGYDDLVLPEPSFIEFNETTDVKDEPVFSWVGDGDKPNLADYLTDHFFINWPQDMEIGNLNKNDIQFKLMNNLGEELVLPVSDYDFKTMGTQSQIALSYVNWAFTPVYNKLELSVNVDGELYQKVYDVASVYTHMVQTGGGNESDGTVIAYQFFGLENLNSWSQVVSKPTYVFAYKSPEAGPRDPYEFYYAEDENGNGYITTSENEAKVFEEERADIKLQGNTVFMTLREESPKILSYDAQDYELKKVLTGGKAILPSEDLKAEEGYVLTPSANWDTHQRWAWLTFNNQGWMKE